MLHINFSAIMSIVLNYSFPPNRLRVSRNPFLNLEVLKYVYPIGGVLKRVTFIGTCLELFHLAVIVFGTHLAGCANVGCFVPSSDTDEARE